MAEKLLISYFHPMLNRLLHYPPPPNVKPTRRKTPVALVESSVMKKVATKQVPMDFRPAHPDVALRAYYIFINEGSRHGSDIRHWLEAELQLVAEYLAA